MIMAEQKGDDVEVQINDETRVISDCDCLKLMRTFYGKPGPKYTSKYMDNFGFELKSE